MIKKSVGGKIIVTKANSELVTSESCGLSPTVNIIRLTGFFIKNEDTKDIYVRINNGSDMLLKTGELYSLEGLTQVESCIVTTDNARIRWGGLR